MMEILPWYQVKHGYSEGTHDAFKHETNDHLREHVRLKGEETMSYEDVHESCMEEDRSEKPPYLGFIPHPVRVVAAKGVKDDPWRTEEVLGVHGVLLGKSGYESGYVD